MAKEALDRIAARTPTHHGASTNRTANRFHAPERPAGAAAQSLPYRAGSAGRSGQVAGGHHDAQAAARLQLKKLLAKQPATAREVKHLLDVQKSGRARQEAGIVAGDRSIVGGKGVKISGNVITGDIGGSVTIGGPRS